MIDDTKTGPSQTNSKLFSVEQITLAAFLGSPIAGCLLLVRNYRELGKGGAAWQALAAGTASSILFLLISILLAGEFPQYGVTFCLLFRPKTTRKISAGRSDF